MPGLEEPERQWRHSTVTRDEVLQSWLSVTHHWNNTATGKTQLTSNIYFMRKTIVTTFRKSLHYKGAHCCVLCRTTMSLLLIHKHCQSFCHFEIWCYIFGGEDCSNFANHYNFYSASMGQSEVPGTLQERKFAIFFQNRNKLIDV